MKVAMESVGGISCRDTPLPALLPAPPLRLLPAHPYLPAGLPNLPASSFPWDLHP